MIQSTNSAIGSNYNQDEENIQKSNTRLDNSGKELNVHKIHRANNFYRKKKNNQNNSHISMIDLFPPC